MRIVATTNPAITALAIGPQDTVGAIGITPNLSSDAWTPATVADKVRLPVSSPVTSAFPKSPLGRLYHNIPLNDFRAGRYYAAAVI